jgi:biopolymer transport protein ExbD/biopolymer transport protein TolR
MAVSLRKHDEDFDDQPMSEINVTPLVDVMLVLLIIFMVAAPLMVSGVPVDLPKTRAKQLNDQKPPLAVSVDASGKYFVGPEEVPAEQLLSTLLNHAENELDRRIHVRADKNLPYHQVLEVMAQINGAGFSKVALVSEAPAGAAGAAAPKPAVDAQPVSQTPSNPK